MTHMDVASNLVMVSCVCTRVTDVLLLCYGGTQAHAAQDVSQLAAGQYRFGVQLSGGAAGADSETVFTIGEQVSKSDLSSTRSTVQQCELGKSRLQTMISQETCLSACNVL